MTVLMMMGAAAIVLAGGGWAYSRFLARSIGEDPTRPTPAIVREDGYDYVPTPTPVVFAHHFASIAGAGPILGPVIAIIYGWVPALLWVLFGGVLIGAVHDYLATFMSTREGGQSIATIVRRIVGKDAFIAMTILLIVMLALVCAAFLNASAAALTSVIAVDRLGLGADQNIFRLGETGGKAVVGGIASMSVIVITAIAPVLGWLYLKRGVPVWICSIMAVAICSVSIYIGLRHPVAFEEKTSILWWTFNARQIWILLLSFYVLVAAGVPVWIFLQSRDFINVHILYVGMAALLVTLVVAGIRGADIAQGIPAVNIDQGNQALGFIWPGMFIVIACGAVSGFHSLCAGGTTCKQIKAEGDARKVGYCGMLLESFLAVCVIGVLVIGATRSEYIADVHPALAGLAGKSNPILGFATAVGRAVNVAFGLPTAVGLVGGMVLLEGFLVTTLDTAIRLTRYLIEEIWRTFFGRYDVFATPVAARESQWGRGEEGPVGAEGLPIAPPNAVGEKAPPFPIATSGLTRVGLKLLRQYWFNSGLAVGLMLLLAMTGGVTALWGIFATSNQLLAAMVLAIAALWLMRRRRRAWFAIIPAIAMLATTTASLILLLGKFADGPRKNNTLLAADIIIMAITAYLLVAGVRAAVTLYRSMGNPPNTAA